MKNLYFFIFFFLACILGKFAAKKPNKAWLKICEETTGKWQRPVIFPSNSYACGVKVINENPEIDTSLNGISFQLCSNEDPEWKKVFGSEWGNWKKPVSCPPANYIAGFQAKSAHFIWDTNASWDGLKIYCEPSKTWVLVEEGNTGDWKNPVIFNKKVCGAQVKAQKPTVTTNVNNDGLNGLKVKLCA